ncbi:MAG TPA: sarcosine oxidase subunit gamma family protein [Xanthobacteraceae bacterium]|nr:sarcosine oxidase subunit gamma family protein [Xanthobacteraceae bacterium]
MLDLASATAHPLDGLPAAPGPAATLRRLPELARLAFRGREAAIGPAGEAFGVALPRQACRFDAAGERRALWLGPDEWLLTAPDAEGPALFAAIEAATAGLPHALVDVGARSIGIEVVGPEAAFVLNQGCPLDLALDAFPVGMCTRTVLGKVEIVLLRTAPETFEIDVWRSFASYVWSYLIEARREFA